MTATAICDTGLGPALYCGSTTTFLGDLGPNVVRYRQGVWQPVGGPRDGIVTDMAVYDPGDGAALYVLGYFPGFDNGHNAALLRYDGQSWIAIPGLQTSATSPPRALTVFDDGAGAALFIGGRGLLGDHDLVRWAGAGFSAIGNDTGALGTGIYDLAVYDPDGPGLEPPALIATGDFSTLGSAPVSGIARRTGNTWAPLGSGLNGTGLVLAVVDLGAGPRLCVGGEFSQAGGYTSNPAVWDGQAWSPLGTGTSGGMVRALAAFPTVDGTQLIAGGKFTSAGGNPASGIAAWNGSAWKALGTGLDFVGSSYDGAHALHVIDDGRGAQLLVGGRFKNAGGVLGKVVAWNGVDWQPLENGVSDNWNIAALYYAPQEGRLYAGGTFTAIGGLPSNRMAAWDAGGWHDLGGQLSMAGGQSVDALLAFDNGSGPRLHAIGHFSLADDPNGRGGASWDGAAWSALGSGVTSGSDAAFLAAACVYDNGAGPQLYVGGWADNAGGFPVTNVARWNGHAWSAVGAGINGFVYDLLVHDDGSGPALYAAAYFGSSQISFVMRWNGTTWVPTGSSFNGIVSALASYTHDGTHLLYAAGDFTQVGAVTAGRVAAWDGHTWAAVGSGLDDWVYALDVVEHPGGPTLFAAGTFGNILPDQPCPMLAAWDGEHWTPVFSNIDGGGYALALHSALVDGEISLFVGGLFRVLDDAIAGGIARLRYIPTPCLGDMNCDGGVTFADIDNFVAALRGPAAWQGDPANAGCPWANGDCSGDGTVTFADIDPFVARLGSVCE